jgi:enoyl-CoA hydratase
MTGNTKNTWHRHGAIGILELPDGPYLPQPDFMPVEELKGYLEEPGLKGVIIRGSGRHFSAGADVDQLRKLAQEEDVLMRKMLAGKALIGLIEDTPLPVVAEISGACFGGGLEIALACHIRISSETALFAFPETGLGIMPGLGGTASLPRAVGQGKAAEMILGGDIINAPKALEIRLVDYIAPAKSLHEFALAYLHKLTNDREVEVIRSVMVSLSNARHLPEEKALEEETRLFCALAVKNLKSP